MDDGETLARAFLALLERHREDPRKLKDLALMCRHMSEASEYSQDPVTGRRMAAVLYAKAEITALARWV